MKEATFEQIENWLGTDRQLNEAIEVIKGLVNGDYHPEIIKNDIIRYAEDERK